MKINPKLVILIGALGVSTSPILIKSSQSPALTIAFYRMLTTVILLTPFILAKNLQELKALTKKHVFQIMISGIFLGLHFSAWILSLKFTTVASATVLVNTSPVMLLLITYFIFKEKSSRTEVIAILFAFLGSIILTLGDFSGGSNAVLGDLYAVAGAAFICVYLIIGNKVRQDVSMPSYTYLTYAFAMVTIFVTNLFVGQDMIVTAPREYLLFLGMAIFPTLLGHSLFNWSLKYVNATFVSMAILTEPIIASIFAIFLFTEIPTATQIIGSIIILSALAVYNNAKKTPA
ncbi:DMT family transporter [Acidaminobacter sp. JC074]|uniref:DMT family transporter n=1 Tax=Acidaminobacter sp. JC074 TaxID=2530199 RepID=UPI001F117D0F|nr:DMT family transporter [Acidaminobacter sp. JC074]MCH4889195.1 DMT family transporter [Acidaminobacter sp. JC074]